MWLPDILLCMALDHGALFEELFHKYAAQLAAFAFRMVRSRDVAEEIVQSVFLTLWEQRATISHHNNMRAYLYTSVRRRALDVMKHDAIAAKYTAKYTAESVNKVTDSPERVVEHEEMVNALEHAIAELPERARQIALLRWYDNLSYDEIAGVMEIAPKTVENQLRIAKAAIKEKLGVFDSSIVSES